MSNDHGHELLWLAIIIIMLTGPCSWPAKIRILEGKIKSIEEKIESISIEKEKGMEK